MQPSEVEISIWRVLTDTHYRQRLLAAADLAVNGYPLEAQQIRQIRTFSLPSVRRAVSELIQRIHDGYDYSIA